MKTQKNVKTLAAGKVVKNEVVKSETNTVRSWARHMVMKMQMRGVDAACAWLGSEISDKLCNTLSEYEGKLAGVKLGTKDKVLVVEASKVFGWRVAVNADVYGRQDGLLLVKGSISLLRKIYGEKNVYTVADGKEADKLTKGKKWEKDCRKALGLA